MAKRKDGGIQAHQTPTPDFNHAARGTRAPEMPDAKLRYQPPTPRAPAPGGMGVPTSPQLRGPAEERSKAKAPLVRRAFNQAAGLNPFASMMARKRAQREAQKDRGRER